MSDLCRDWLKTLWRASFKGVLFWFEQDKEEGGRGLVIHEFPNRDDPYVEDLGEAPRYYSGSAYVHGEDADALADALKTALASRGAGTLVVPYFGPVTVHCQTFERSTQRDQLGYVAFELKFVRKGAATAFVSVPFLQTQGFAAVDSLARLTGQLFPQSVTTKGEPDYVVETLIDTLQSGIATIDVLRQARPTDPTVSASLRDTLADLFGATSAALDNTAPAGPAAATVAGGIIAAARTLGDALPAPIASSAGVALAEAFPSTVRIVSAPFLPASATRAAVNAAAAARVVRLAGLMAYADGVLRMTFAARPDGVTARAEVAERFETELDDTTGAANAALYLAIDAVRAKVIDWLTRTINDLAPIITVDSNAIRPSLDLAWTLYADPSRAPELVARNSVRHPSFMPREIEAVAR